MFKASNVDTFILYANKRNQFSHYMYFVHRVHIFIEETCVSLTRSCIYAYLKWVNNMIEMNNPSGKTKYTVFLKNILAYVSSTFMLIGVFSNTYSYDDDDTLYS